MKPITEIRKTPNFTMSRVEIQEAIDAAKVLKHWCDEHAECEECPFCPCNGGKVLSKWEFEDEDE